MNYTRGLPKDLVTLIRNEFSISEFVETGTYTGKTAKWASSHFSKVITVEASSHYYDLLAPEHSLFPNIQFVFGDSREQLVDIVPSLDGPALFWLDGHWSGGRNIWRARRVSVN